MAGLLVRRLFLKVLPEVSMYVDVDLWGGHLMGAGLMM